jgi:hypothetical protein
MSIRCAHCKGYHDSIQGVKDCSQVLVTTVPAADVRSAQAQMDAELERINQRSADRQTNGHETGWAPYRRSAGGSAFGRMKDAAAKLPALPHARYAVQHQGTLKFYQVDKPGGRWKGYTFLRVWASDEKHPVKSYDTMAEVFALIAVDPQAAMRAFTDKIGQCAICGRTLTHETSRANGVGPVCGAKMGY